MPHAKKCCQNETEIKSNHLTDSINIFIVVVIYIVELQSDLIRREGRTGWRSAKNCLLSAAI